MGFFSDINSVLGNLAPLNNAGGLIDPQEALAAKQQALLTQGASLLQAGGPSPYPVSFGQALGSALMRGQAAQNAAIDDALKRKLVASEILARMAPPDRKIIAVQTPQGPRLMPEQDAVRLGLAPYNPNEAYQNAEIQHGKDQLAVDRERIAAENKRAADALAARPGPDAELDKPYSPGDLEKLRLPNGDKPPVGFTPRMAQLLQATTTTQPEIDRKNAESTAKQSLDQLEGMALDPKQGVLVGNPSSVPMQSLQQSGQAIGHFLGTEASGQRQKYVDARKALVISLATAENPNDAVARESAIKRWEALVPDINTPEPEARSKFALLRSRLGGSASAQANNDPLGIR